MLTILSRLGTKRERPVNEESRDEDQVEGGEPLGISEGQELRGHDTHDPEGEGELVHQLDLGHLLHVVPNLLVRVPSHSFPQSPLGPTPGLRQLGAQLSVRQSGPHVPYRLQVESGESLLLQDLPGAVDVEPAVKMLRQQDSVGHPSD